MSLSLGSDSTGQGGSRITACIFVVERANLYNTVDICNWCRFSSGGGGEDLLVIIVMTEVVMMEVTP